MGPILDCLKKARRVYFIVGYDKRTMDLAELKRTMRAYLAEGFHIRVWPNYHAKLWSINGVRYCGSQNFSPAFGPNYMVRTTDEGVGLYIGRSFAIAMRFDHRTKLELVPNYKMP